jgi:hypothetical protein
VAGLRGESHLAEQLSFWHYQFVGKLDNPTPLLIGLPFSAEMFIERW